VVFGGLGDWGKGYVRYLLGYARFLQVGWVALEVFSMTQSDAARSEGACCCGLS